MNKSPTVCNSYLKLPGGQPAANMFGCASKASKMTPGSYLSQWTQPSFAKIKNVEERKVPHDHLLWK